MGERVGKTEGEFPPFIWISPRHITVRTEPGYGVSPGAPYMELGEGYHSRLTRLIGQVDQLEEPATQIVRQE